MTDDTDTLDGFLTARRDGANRDDRATRVALVRAAAILLAIALCTACATPPPPSSPDPLAPASTWHLSDMHFGRWWQ